MRQLFTFLAFVSIISFCTQTYAAKVFVSATKDRNSALTKLLAQQPLPDFKGKTVAVKANFNSADAYPATTNLETLEFIFKFLKHNGAKSIVMPERSGMGNTKKVLEKLGVFNLAKKYEVRVSVLDEIDDKDWDFIQNKADHWPNGYAVAQAIRQADFVVNLPCLKTHRFGGGFTLSLKNNVGVVAKHYKGNNFMHDLHSSPDQKKMIAEINQNIPCNLIVMDATKAFVKQGPEKGKLESPGLFLMSTDRVAMDAVGVAILRTFDTTDYVKEGPIFELDQIKVAADLGLGAKTATDIEVIATDEAAKKIVKKIQAQLK